MKANRMPKNATIGIFCPSHVGDRERYRAVLDTMERLGYRVKLGANFEKDSYGYAASAQERADDLNALIADEEVRMVLFSGGESAVEVLPLIDYENIRRHPKLFSSYSDGTSILNAIHAQTGLITYYGWGAGQFRDLRYYDYMQFCAHFIEGHEAKRFVSDSRWKTLSGGSCAGKLIGGYASLFALMLANRYFCFDERERYILFLEDNERFSDVGAVSTYLAFIEQSAFMRNVAGLMFGHYAADAPEDLLHRLARFGAANNIPVVYTDDFGHGTKHAILPIGTNAEFDADRQTLIFC